MLRNRWHAFKSLGIHWLQAIDDHSLQSPFVYNFYRQVIEDRPVLAMLPLAELVTSVRSDHQVISLTDFGAGADRIKQRKISYIARTSHNQRVGRFMHRLCQFLNPSSILELGTNLGFSSAAMAMAAPTANLVTVEGCGALAKMAHAHFQLLGLNHIKVVHSQIDHFLEQGLSNYGQWDLIYLDANHRYQPTVKYFEACVKEIHQKSVMVLDDIHWSPGMSRAWHQLRNHKQVTLSLDLFRLGILFFDEKLPKKHYILE